MIKKRLLLLLCLLASSSRAQTNANSPSALDYSAFRIVTERNIFNPHRSTRYVPPSRTSRRTTPRADFFALLGIMSYDGKGPFAFFDGSSSDYRKVLKQNDKIAGFTVTAIEASQVKLNSSSNLVELRVGMQLSHDENDEWHVADRPESSVSPPSLLSGTNRPSYGFARASNNSRATNGLAVNALNAQPSRDSELPTDSVEPAGSGAPAEPAATPASNENDVLERLRRRAAAERGENPP